MSTPSFDEVEDLAHRLLAFCENGRGADDSSRVASCLEAIADVEQRLHRCVASMRGQTTVTRELPFYAVRLQELFDRHRRPDGRPWTMVEVATHIGCSPSYLRGLRHGLAKKPGRLADIAAFFGEDVATFFPNGRVEPTPLPAYAQRLQQLFQERRQPDGQPWTQTAIARASGCSPAVLSRLLRGEQASPKPETLAAITRAFDVLGTDRTD